VSNAVTLGHTNLHQGYFAEAFVASIAAAAGLDVQLPRLGRAIDLGVYSPGPNGTSSSRQITLQVKSWSTGRLSTDGHFHYPLEVPAFNYLAGNEHDVRHYLVLCVVPNNPVDYATASHQQLRLMQAAYWLSLRNEHPNANLNPDSTKTILVPQTQLLTTETMCALLNNREDLAVTS
jgi:hypothetical protein